MKESLNRPLTITDAIKVVGIILAVLAVGAGIYWAGASIWRARQIKATIPQLIEAARAQRQQMITAIEGYHAHFGFYPPDHVISREPLVVDARTNQLNYELNGTMRDRSQTNFFLPSKKEPITTDEIMAFFNVNCFSNTVFRPQFPTNFLTGFPVLVRALDPNSDAWGLTIFDGDAVPAELSDAFDISPWRYRCTSPEHNSGKFDLWIEINVSGKHFLLGNWKEAE